MDRKEVTEQVIEIVKEVLETEDAGAESKMQEELEIESLDFYELLGALEHHFRVRIPEKILADTETVGDIADAVIRIMEKNR